MKRNRRVEKTKEALFQALLGLLEQKRYSAISIQEIIDAADVGRTTFYAHFYSKDDLLKAFIEKVSDSIHENQESVHTLFTHIQENSTQIRALIADTACAELLFQTIKACRKQHLLQSGVFFTAPLSDLPMDLLVNHLVQTLAECIRWWLQTGMEQSPEEMERCYHLLTA